MTSLTDEPRIVSLPVTAVWESTCVAAFQVHDDTEFVPLVLDVTT